MNPRIAIMTDDPGWHGERLRRAFARKGLETTFLSLTECRMDLCANRWGIVLPGFEAELPAGVFVRGVPGGTLEQVVFRLDILHALRELGVPVYNDARAIERSVDKAMTSFLLHNAGIPTPATWVAESESRARALIMAETAHGRRTVIKPLFGSQGVGLKRLAAVSDLPPAADYDGVYYLQRYVDSGEGAWHDWRVFVIGGQAVAAMVRRGKSWISNVAQGAACEIAEIGSGLQRMAEGAVRVLDMDYAGVDIIRGGEGRTYVLEVNSIPAWKGLQSVCRTDVAELLADDFIGRRLQRVLLRKVEGGGR